jgi:hypothetical protein
VRWQDKPSDIVPGTQEYMTGMMTFALKNKARTRSAGLKTHFKHCHRFDLSNQTIKLMP